MKKFISLSILLSFPVIANDGFSAIRAGGIVFSKTDAVEMKEEVLTISPDQINVKYKFVNDTDKPVTGVISFPLPDITCGYWGANKTIEDFKTLVDGKEIKTQMIDKAVMKGKDVSAQVKKAGLPLDCMKVFEDKELFKKAQKAKLADDYQGTDPEDLKFQTSRMYIWNQTYAPKTPVSIEHTYTPINGKFVAGASNYYYNLGLHCDRDPNWKWLNQSNMDQLDTDLGNGTTVEYILTTAKTWKGDIGSFRLVLKKKNKNDFVCSTLGPLKKIDDLTYEFKATFMRPDRELTVVYGDGKK